MFRLAIYFSFLMIIFSTGNMIFTPVWAKELKIISYPEGSDIYVKSLVDFDYKKIGVTPLTISFDEVIKNFTSAEVFMIEIRKDDYKPFRVIVSDFSSADLTVNARLDVKNDYEMNTAIEEVATEILEAQRLVRVSKYDEGLEKLKNLEKKFSKVSLIFEMQGNIYYLKKDTKKALDAYSLAFIHNPKNLDAYKMKLYLEKTLVEQPRKPDVGK